ncbi:hypothetical protein BG454_13505 [Roseinatronobacter bogoriensis subsp. barguzinensis]|uniref:Helix-turn-helix domain-containing protein n=2 Tax=Roseinatronobacter bogoriensis TaxID=119542 RepID=A0A2K8KK53_9RHOB|nr:helix-turn-helix domain-containing protein [Rhodobaca barguzinensis]ATX66710.1 hypothetical protein BG454_13505 [Rhodobaca barguzinensis]
MSDTLRIQRASDRAEPDPRLVHRTHHRLEWLKRALQADVTDRAKTLASALSVKWANDQTGQCNPSLREICAFLGWNKDKARRAIADLIEGGLLERVVGKGRGRKSGYMFLGPSNVVPLPSSQPASKVAETPRYDPEKRSQICTNQKADKGSTGAAKRSQKCTPLYKDEHTMEHTKAETGCAGDDVSEAFDRFWKTYPKPRDFEKSKRLFVEAVVSGVDPVWIISSAERVNATIGKDRHYFARSDRWLEERRWTQHPQSRPGNVIQSSEGAELRDIASFFASKIKEGRYVAPSAISASLAAEIVGRGLATAEQMRGAGFRV